MLKRSVNEGAMFVASLFRRTVDEGRHKPGCSCGFCKNMGKGFKKKSAPDEKAEPDEKDTPTEPEKKDSFLESVKLSKGTVKGTAAKKYLSQTSKNQDKPPGSKVKNYIAAAGEVAGLSKSEQRGFKSKDAGSVMKKRTESSVAVQLADTLLS